MSDTSFDIEMECDFCGRIGKTVYTLPRDIDRKDIAVGCTQCRATYKIDVSHKTISIKTHGSMIHLSVKVRK